MRSMREITTVTKGKSKKALLYFTLGSCCLLLFVYIAFQHALAGGIFLGLLAGGFFLLMVYELQTRIAETKKLSSPKLDIPIYTTNIASDNVITPNKVINRITDKVPTYVSETLTTTHEKVTLDSRPSQSEAELVAENGIIELVQTEKRRAVLQ